MRAEATQSKLVAAIARFVAGLGFVALATTVAFAQDDGGGLAAEGAVVNEELGVTISTPEGWEAVKTQGNEKSIANFRHPESQSQIEVIGARLFNDDVAQVFFDTFHETLVSTEFSEASAATAARIGDVEGTRAEYAYEHTGIQLRVVVFTFVRDEAAYMVVGYFKDEERDTYVKTLETLVETLTFS